VFPPFFPSSSLSSLSFRFPFFFPFPPLAFPFSFSPPSPFLSTGRLLIPPFLFFRGGARLKLHVSGSSPLSLSFSPFFFSLNPPLMLRSFNLVLGRRAVVYSPLFFPLPFLFSFPFPPQSSLLDLPFLPPSRTQKE